MKRHAKVDIDNTEQTTASSEGIYYLDANNLYGGAMHRMKPYELVGVPERQEVMERINRDPNGWIQSLKTFGKYGFFIECDTEAPVELHDKFNDLPFFPVQKAGMYSDGIKKYAEKNDIVDKVKETNPPKLICDLDLVASISFITLCCNWVFNRDIASHTSTTSFDSNRHHSSSNM